MEAELSATATLATAAGGGGEADVTVSAALPLRPSLVAVICTVPTATAATRPDPETVATAELLEIQLTARPVRTTLLASRVVAVAWVVWPGFSELAASSTLVDATGVDATGSTVSAAPPLWPTAVAVTTVSPTASDVTCALLPLLLIDATAGLLSGHVIGPPGTL